MNTIYLDNSATTRPTEQVTKAMCDCMREGFYNPSALYKPAMLAEKQMTLCREAIAKELHASPDRVVFTGCGTEADNLAILGGLAALHGKGRLLYTAGEHPAVKEACRLAEKDGFDVQEIPLRHDGLVDLDALNELLCENTRMLCVMQVNNETGAVMQLGEIAKLRDQKCPNALLHVDGVQGFLREELNMEKLGVDSYALSAHKIHGPKGVGALVMGKRMRVLPRLPGGGQEKGLRSGTENTPGIAGLLAAVQNYPKTNDMRARKLQLYHEIKTLIPSVTVNGPAPDADTAADHVLNLSFVPVRAETLLHALEGDGIYVGNGSACSSHKNKTSDVLRAMQVLPKVAESALRFSLNPYITEDEITATAQAVAKEYEILKRFERR